MIIIIIILFCFVNSTNIKEKSKFIVSISPDCVILYEINSSFANTIQINKYMFKAPIIKNRSIF